jgi:transglutaminase superfamily protein
MTHRAPDWAFLLASSEASEPPPVPMRLRAGAAVHSARVLRMLRNQGWGPAHRYLQQLRPLPGSGRYTALPPLVAIRLARQEILWSQLVLRVVEPDGLCLPRSLSLTVYLSALGLPCEVTVARELCSSNPQYSFHSWAELHGEVLNDTSAVKQGFKVLQRVSAHALAARKAGGTPAAALRTDHVDDDFRTSGQRSAQVALKR